MEYPFYLKYYSVSITPLFALLPPELLVVPVALPVLPVPVVPLLVLPDVVEPVEELLLVLPVPDPPIED